MSTNNNLDVLQGGDPMRLLSRLSFALLPLLCSVTASASLPTYWGLGGANATLPIGSSRDSNYPFAIGNNVGYSVSFEFGQYFGPRIGYNMRLVGNDFFNNKHRKPVSKNIFPISPDGMVVSPYSAPWGLGINYQYFSAGVNYKYPKYDVIFNANVTIGSYKSSFSMWKLWFIVDELPGEDNPPGENVYKQPEWVGGTTALNDAGTLGIELGMTKKLMWGLHGNVFYHYSSLDKDKVGVGSVQFSGIGIKYLWGRGR